ncbi:MAG: peptide chain release factor 3 [Armatimonadetes bacterium]|nr:peptide chain release factor 3 [Armatimonadota bacterium]
MMKPPLAEEIQRRRTFAIISHPDAGKTTLTEKLLLYGGALDLAGAVKAKKNQRSATSDWMALEQERGISVTSTVLQFPYNGFQLNLLDTPGHQDFSEDTYRTLMAADHAVMLIDSAKGVEPQTIKLFHVCRKRGLPIFTFFNKMDRPGQDPLELLGELEDVLGIRSVPMNWPLGMGDTFKGVYDLRTKQLHLFERTQHGAKAAPVQVTGVDDPALRKLVDDQTYQQFRDEIELLEGAGEEFDRERILAGQLTPVFFGSAANNFGVQLFLDTFLTIATPPGPRMTPEGPLPPESEGFSGFIFKVQANMDRRHRDRVAFMRVCSGRFERDMAVYHPRQGKNLRLSRPHKLFAQERETVEEAYPGDIVGLINPGVFSVGDTLYAGAPVEFEPMPRFALELFATLYNPDPNKRKSFQKGIDQLREEGAVQVFYHADRSREPIVAAVGRLQFDVVQFRLETEYDVKTKLEMLNYTHVRWLDGEVGKIKEIRWPTGTALAEDVEGRPVGLFAGEWNLNYLREKNPDVRFLDSPMELQESHR